jgi:asparagine synthase (glutamine-hydrolysing)
MCGILALLGHGHSAVAPLNELERYVSRLDGRGPEGLRLKHYKYTNDDYDQTEHILGFTRLAINGLNEAGMQPFEWTAADGSHYAWICNGEIYNWAALAAEYSLEADVAAGGGSDCFILGPLYHRLKADPIAFARALDGVFAFVIIDLTAKQYIIARDPYGVRPLFVAQDYIYKGGYFNMVASEMKALKGLSEHIAPFMPGTIRVANTDAGHRSGVDYKYHTVPYEKIAAFSNLELAEMAVARGLRAAVRKRLMTERPVAALLSGGVDSSLIAALVADELKAAGVERPLETFSIGFAGSEDLRHARMVAEWIGSEHHEITMTADEFFAAIPEVVKAIESFDVTTVRASVGNYLVSKAVKEQSDCKVVFNGDGADEIFGSYLYFYKAPSDGEFERESERLLEDIHYFDVARSDRSISSNGLEPRTPFLDKAFVGVARGLPTKWRRPGCRHVGTAGGAGEEPICEKWILRRAFEEEGLLPPAVLWRRKEAFSDGVSGPVKSWYEEIHERVEALVPADWAMQAKAYKHVPPATAEAFYYRRLFEQYYGNSIDIAKAAVPYKWMPRWVEGAVDPSARTLAVYKEGGGGKV